MSLEEKRGRTMGGPFVNSGGCGGLQPSELFSATFPLPDGSRSGAVQSAPAAKEVIKCSPSRNFGAEGHLAI